MNLDDIRKTCLSFPHATERLQWVRDIVFKVGGKMFCVANTEPDRDEPLLSFKVTEEEFVALQENEGVIPAPYMARAKWVALESYDALPAAEVRRLLRQSYELVRSTLPKKVQAELAFAKPPARRKSRK